ncbi:MAG TPA: D-alanine--D-alanine ligase [bacterium]
MSRGRVAIAHYAPADPRRPHPDAAPHLIHDEIPLIEAALAAAGYEPFTLPVGDDIPAALAALAARPPRAVVNLCDDLPGGSEHEMYFAAALELLGISYTGSPPLALGLCRDKVKTKLILRGHGIPTAPFVLADSPDAPLEALRFPVIVKPATEDGSLGITDASVAADEAAARRAIAAVHGRYGPVLVEEFIEGRELNAPVFGNVPARMLPVSEIDFTGLPAGAPRICGYEAKWEQDDARYSGTVGVCPAHLTPEVRSRLEHWSLLAFRALGLRDYARIDWRLSPTRGLMALEANPNPDISPSSGYARSLRAGGLDYAAFVLGLAEAAIARG